jgi:hypothetical protein
MEGGKESTVRPRRRWNNMKTYLKGIGWAGVDWMDLVQDRDKGQAFVCTVTSLHVSYKAKERLGLRSVMMIGNPCHEGLQSFQKNKGFFLHLSLTLSVPS